MSAGRGRTLDGAYSHAGLVRALNEDSVISDPPLYAVADGLGGHQAGEVASRLALRALLQNAPRQVDTKGLARAVRAANREVIAAAESRGREGMGTTLTAAMVEGTRVAIAHVGDSRAYMLEGEQLVRLTEDHSLVADMVRAGTLDEDGARRHPNRSVITRALGTDPNMVADTYEIAAASGDRLMLCTDGLYGMIPDEDIERILASNPDPDIAARSLVDAALEAGGQDNVSVVVVDLVEGVRSPAAARSAARRAAPLLWVGVAAAMVAGASWSAWSYANSRAFLIAEGGHVAVYRGIPGSFAGLSLAWMDSETTVPVDALPPQTAARLRDGIPLADIDDAHEAVARYRSLVGTATAP